MPLQLVVSNKTCRCETCLEDSVKRRQAFQARHPGVVFGFTPGRNFSACYADRDGQPREIMCSRLADLMGRLEDVEHTILEDSPAP